MVTQTSQSSFVCKNLLKYTKLSSWVDMVSARHLSDKKINLSNLTMEFPSLPIATGLNSHLTQKTWKKPRLIFLSSCGLLMQNL